MPLGDLLGLLSFAHDQSSEALAEAALPVVRELVRHGMLRPVGRADR
jgi:hypothetical protein